MQIRVSLLSLDVPDVSRECMRCDERKQPSAEQARCNMVWEAINKVPAACCPRCCAARWRQGSWHPGRCVASADTTREALRRSPFISREASKSGSYPWRLIGG